MNTHQQYQANPPSWGPKLSPWLIALLRRPRQLLKTLREQGLESIEVHGLEPVSEAIETGKGVLITPNHPSHADHYVLLEIADRICRPFYFMVAWQVFASLDAVSRAVMWRHGCFSVDREGADWVALQRAVEILRNRSNPLVIFPEGDIYHHNDRVAPFQQGCGIIAQSAARRTNRPIVCFPCALQYDYVTDPSPELNGLTAQLEEAALRSPRPQLPLNQRVQRLLSGLLRQREREHFGCWLSGSASERIARISESLLAGLEREYGIRNAVRNVPARVQVLRRHMFERCKNETPDKAEQAEIERISQKLSFVIQLFSYPPAYLEGQPSIERVAETLDKLEEDVLGVPAAPPRGSRKATVRFGDPISVDPLRSGRRASMELTNQLEASVAALLSRPDQTPAPREPVEPVAAVHT